MALPSAERNQDVTSLPQGHMRHPGLNHAQTAPTNQGVTSLPYWDSQPLMALTSTERNHDVTDKPRDQLRHQGINHTQPAPTAQNLTSHKSSIAQFAAIPIYQVASTSTQSQSIPAAIHEPPGKIPQKIANPLLNDDDGHEESEPLSKRTKHETGAAYKPDVINFPNSFVAKLSEYTLYV